VFTAGMLSVPESLSGAAESVGSFRDCFARDPLTNARMSTQRESVCRRWLIPIYALKRRRAIVQSSPTG
jgi:hypothetical protein